MTITYHALFTVIINLNILQKVSVLYDINTTPKKIDNPLNSRATHIFEEYNVRYSRMCNQGSGYIQARICICIHDKMPSSCPPQWCCGFYVTHQQGHAGFELFFKTRELKKKWLEQFEMAM